MPQAVPKEIVGRLNLAVRDVVQDTQVGEKLLQLGAEPMATTSDEFDAFFKGEVAQWKKVVQSSKIRVD
ncbi:Tripartite tricarboxylate transporter family receptor [compost metagenome]